MFLHEDEAKAAAHDLWLADRRANQMKAIDDEQDKQLLPDDETWTFCVNGPVKADCRITRVGCFFAEKAARVAWLAEMRSHQMEPISKEQGERIDPQELVWYAGNGVVEEDRLIVVFPSLEKGQLYFSARAAQAALDRAKGVESHETPVGETQPKEAATDETQDKAMKPVEHKLPDIPSWAPPLPEGYVPLGFGGTFKVERPFGGGCSTKVSPKWDAWHMDIGWCGDKTSGFYIAPRDSEIVRLNFPWLAEEAKKANAKPNHEPISVLDEAKACVCGPRRRDYGTPDENFGRIADLWNVHLKDKLAKPMTPGDVAMMMILLKVARQANSPKRDNLVDIAGYAQCASELKEEK